jgi:hypothetical protein
MHIIRQKLNTALPTYFFYKSMVQLFYALEYPSVFITLHTIIQKRLMYVSHTYAPKNWFLDFWSNIRFNIVLP